MPLEKLLFMKANNLTFLFLALLISNLLFSQENEVFDKKWIEEIANSESRKFSKKDVVISTHTLNYDVKYHRIELDIDPNFYNIEGIVTTYFESKESISNIKFDLSTKLSVSDVIYNNKSINYSHSNDILTCELNETIPSGKLDSIKISYAGAPSSGESAFTKASHNGIPIIWTLSEPYGARDWWPCKQDLIDKADSVDIIVKSPKEYRTASNGSLISEVIEGDYNTCHWKHNYPIPAYLIAFATTNYVDYSHNYEGRYSNNFEILNYVYPENESTAFEATKYTLKVMDIFEELFEVYPYSSEKYGHAQFGWGGGMEHTTMSFMGGFSEDLIAHELAHQWFGDKITCGSWKDIWLNEGFATYLTGLSYEKIEEKNFQSWLNSTINNVCSQPSGSVYVEDTTNVSRIFSSRLSYSKGAMVLHMLRGKLGDDAFFKSMKDYLKDENTSYAYARTEEFKNIVEESSSVELSAFFSQWVYGEGYPSYNIQWNQDDENNILINIKQDQSDASVDYFQMPIEFKVKDINNIETIVKVENTVDDENFTISFDNEISDINFDPNRWIVSKNNSIAYNPNLSENYWTINNWKVFQNNSSNITIEHEDTKLNSLKVEVYNVSGQLILNKEFNTGISHEINYDFVKGSYLVVVSTKTNKNTFKVSID